MGLGSRTAAKANNEGWGAYLTARVQEVTFAVKALAQCLQVFAVRSLSLANYRLTAQLSGVRSFVSSRTASRRKIRHLQSD
jgi:hypothetical protein